VAQNHATTIEQFLQSLIPAQEVRLAARRVGCVQRQRKVDAYALLMAILLGVSTRGRQSLAEMRRALGVHAGISLVRSAFWERFTPGLEQLVTWVLDRLVTLARGRTIEYRGILESFRDVVAVDATVVKVHDDLARRWRGTRHNSRPAAIKVHTWVRVLTGELLRYQITAETYGDNKALRLLPSARDVLFLFDRGYSSPSLWWRIHRLGGYFLTRLPEGYDPVLIAEHRRHRGRRRRLVGQTWKTAQRRLHRQVVDVEANFKVHVRAYRTRTGRNQNQSFRLVALRDPRTHRYVSFVTNVPTERLPAQSVRPLYRLRWEAETFYRLAKSGSGLHELPSSRPHTVRTLIKASLIRVSLAMQSRTQAQRYVPVDRWINPQQWIQVWRRIFGDLLEDLSAELRGLDVPMWNRLAQLAMDPHEQRIPLRQQFAAGSICLE
jgi:hypothetical protein